LGVQAAHREGLPGGIAGAELAEFPVEGLKLRQMARVKRKGRRTEQDNTQESS